MDKMEAYFDNSATTRVFDCVKDAVVNAMTVDYGNAAARHMKGVEAERLIKEARAEIAKSLKVQEKEILFTSGGTESNNTALIGAAFANQRAGKHLITTGVEHASIYNTMEFLREQGFEITYLPVDSYGCISLEELAQAVREDTILVSVMYVNNEIGAVEPVEEISKVIKAKNPHSVHVDAIQAYGKYVIRPKKQGIDLLSVSGHKKSTAPRAWASSILTGGRKCARFSSAAASRRECDPERRTSWLRRPGSRCAGGLQGSRGED